MTETQTTCDHGGFTRGMKRVSATETELVYGCDACGARLVVARCAAKNARKRRGERCARPVTLRSQYCATHARLHQ